MDKRTVAEAILLRACEPGTARAEPVHEEELDRWVWAAVTRYGVHLRQLILERGYTRLQWTAARLVTELWRPELAEPAEGWPVSLK